MFKNYFKTALRNLFRNKLYSLLNIIGLTFGITCFLLIGLYLFDEITFDRQHSKAKNIYRAIQHRKTPTEELIIAASSYHLSEESKKTIAEIENTARMTRIGRANLTNPENKNTFQETVTYANEGFMEIFDFKEVEGLSKSALKEPNTIVIVEELAQRFFGKTQVVGKTLLFEFMPDQPFTIKAVLKNHPNNSSFDFTAIFSEATFSNSPNFAENNANWDARSYLTFFLLKDGAKPDAVVPKIDRLLNANVKWEPGYSASYSLQPLADMHLYSENIVEGARNNNVAAMHQGVLLYLKIFAIVALFVLLIACINYMNLTTARASSRLKEIGIRKTIGAKRNHLAWQFMTESFLVATISFILSIGCVNLLLPSFNKFVDKQLSLGFSTDYRIWGYTILATLLIGLLSGSYPSLLLSRFKPVMLLKKMKIMNRGGLSLRKGLVVFQFTISIVMIIATIVLFQQVRYANNKNLGFNKELLLVVDINSGKVRRGAETIQSEFRKIPGVKNVSVTSRVPGEWKTVPTIKIKKQGDVEEPRISYFLGVDEDFKQTFELTILKGRNFSGGNDSSAVLLNETAARMLNISEPSGQIVEIPSLAFGGSYFPIDSTDKPFRARVIGIVNDFNFQSIREKIEPMVLGYQYNPIHNIDYFTSRIDGKDIPATLEKMNNVLTKIDQKHLLEYHFLDEQLARFYAEDHRRQTILIWVALATIFIACLGLFGLATYAAEQRIKEIGVRKVLGAGVFNLTTLLSKDFLKLVLIANGVAFPVAWWATNKWLQEFAYHIDLKWWVFVLAGIIAILIALVTVSFQAVKAAIANPVKSLRTE
jgi:putative ABC transport system permease protein